LSKEALSVIADHDSGIIYGTDRWK